MKIEIEVSHNTQSGRGVIKTRSARCQRQLLWRTRRMRVVCVCRVNCALRARNLKFHCQIGEERRRERGRGQDKREESRHEKRKMSREQIKQDKREENRE